MAEIVYEGATTPIRIGGGSGVTVARAQSFGFRASRTVTPVYQMGTSGSIGSIADPWSHTANMTVYTIDTQVERAMAAEAIATNPVTLVDLMEASGLLIETPTRALQGSVVESVSYTVTAPNQPLQATWSFRGTGKTTGAAGIASPSTTGTIAFRSYNLYAEFSTGPTSPLLRIQSITLNGTMRSEDWYELSNADAWHVYRGEPSCTVQITWYNVLDDTSPGTLAYDYRPELDFSDGVNLEIQAVPDGSAWDAAGNIKWVLYNLATSDNNEDTPVTGKSDDSISYTATDPTTGGMTVQVLA